METNEVFVVTDGTEFLTWDDRGAMSTGYPMWVGLKHARQYPNETLAVKAGESVVRNDKIPVWIQKVYFTLSDKTPVLLPESDPEWETYQRLKTKFNKA